MRRRTAKVGPNCSSAKGSEKATTVSWLFSCALGFAAETTHCSAAGDSYPRLAKSPLPEPISRRALFVEQTGPGNSPEDGVLDFADITAFVAAFVDRDDAADLAAPSGVFDLADTVAFVDAFTAGCPSLGVQDRRKKPRRGGALSFVG